MAVKLFHVGIKALVQNDKGEFLLLQVNPAKLSGKQEAYWDIPGGRIEEGGTVIETLAREVDEELGVAILGEPQFFTAVVSNITIPTDKGSVGLVLMIYTVQLASENVRVSDEHLGYEWAGSVTASERLGHKYPAEFTDKIAVL
jgi:8-oxo-dGTP pyrophosphatase MutT (NUDIX family)